MVELVSMVEIADLCGVSINTIKKWRQREYLEFPHPDCILAIGPVWSKARVVRWMNDRKDGRLDYQQRDGNPGL